MKNCFVGDSNTGADWTGRLWSLPHWRYWRTMWLPFCAVCCRMILFEQEGWTKWSSVVTSNSTHFVIRSLSTYQKNSSWEFRKLLSFSHFTSCFSSCLLLSLLLHSLLSFLFSQILYKLICVSHWCLLCCTVGIMPWFWWFFTRFCCTYLVSTTPFLKYAKENWRQSVFQLRCYHEHKWTVIRMSSVLC